MCGIAAIFSLKGKKNLSSIFEMTQLVKHRGPDGEGLVLFTDLLDGTFEFGGDFSSEAALGHRRLSILDLTESGLQPMQEGLLWITFNGEIYNYLEIRADLKKAGLTFRTETDTEVLLKAYQFYGISFLEKLNGMFSFVLVDLKNQKAFAVRDRFGVKPLYYFENNGLLSFASEIKQFQALPEFRAHLNHNRAYDFLNFGIFDHTDETLFRGVHQIRGGHFCEFDLQAKTFEIKRWYKLPKVQKKIAYDEAVKECRALLKDAVEIRLRSDVEVGSCLSGGIDSSSIVCLAADSLKNNGSFHRQKTFSARSQDVKLDEFPFMELVAKHARTDAHYVTPHADGLMQNFNELLWHQDEPFASSSVFAQYALFSKVKDEGIKVMLDGQGADEQLGGYFEYYGIFLRELLNNGQINSLLKEMWGAKNSNVRPMRSLIKHFIPKALKDRLLYSMNKPTSKCPWIDFNALQCTSKAAPFNLQNHSFREYAEEMLLHANLPMLLHYEDRNSMAHSVESRTPFLDYRFVEFILSLPSHFFIKKGVTKRLLRDAMRGLVPERVLDRKDKIAFATDEKSWLGKDHKEATMKIIKEAVQTTGIFTPEIVTKAEAILSGKEPFSFLPFRVIAFAEWFKLNRVKL